MKPANIIIVILLFSSFLASNKCISQELSEDQYNIINSLYSINKNETIIHNKTIDYKSWINLIKSNIEDNNSTCEFDNGQFSIILDRLKNKISSISIKELDPKRLSPNIKLSSEEIQQNSDKKQYPIRSISEPIIIDNFAFIFQKQQFEEFLLIFAKDDKNNWEWKCFIACYLIIVD